MKDLPATGWCCRQNLNFQNWQTTSKECTKVKAARAARLFFLRQPIIWLICGSVVAVDFIVGTFRSRYEYEYDFWAREAWVLAVVDTVVAVVSSQQKYFSNFYEYEVITFCQWRECLVDKQHKMPQSRQNIARQVARNISQCIRAFKD